MKKNEGFRNLYKSLNNWKLQTMKSNKYLRFLNQVNGYTIGTEECVIDAKILEDEDILLYAKNEFTKLFPQYNRKEHNLYTRHYGDTVVAELSLRAFELKEQSDPIDPGIYHLRDSPEYGYYIGLSDFSHTDKPINLSTCFNGKLAIDLNLFFNNKQTYLNSNFKYKRASLVYGPPGNGKTFTIINTLNTLIDKHNLIVLIIDNRDKISISDFDDFRPLLEKYTVVFLIEEITELIGNKEILDFLDGETSWNNCYTIATTNYPEKLPKNIVDRPGRFDNIIKVDHPSREDREIYLKHHLGEVSNDILDRTDKYSIAYLKELIVRSRLYGKTLQEVMRDIDETKKLISRSFVGEKDLTGNYA